MAAKFGRGAILKVAAGTATKGVLGTPTTTIPGLQDTVINTGEPVLVDTTSHETPGLGTDQTVSHMGPGTAEAPIQWDGSLAAHQQIVADQAAGILKTFSLHDSTSGSPGKRWRWNGYFSGAPVTLPVSGIATGQLRLSVEAGWVYEDDV